MAGNSNRRKRHCPTCNTSHFAPSGKKCSFSRVEEVQVHEEDVHSSDEGEYAYIEVTPRGRGKGKSQSGRSSSKPSVHNTRVPPQPSLGDISEEEDDISEWGKEEFKDFVNSMKSVNAKLEATDSKLASMEGLLLQVLQKGGEDVGVGEEAVKSSKRGGKGSSDGT